MKQPICEPLLKDLKGRKVCRGKASFCLFVELAGNKTLILSFILIPLICPISAGRVYQSGHCSCVSVDNLNCARQKVQHENILILTFHLKCPLRYFITYFNMLTSNDLPSFMTLVMSIVNMSMFVVRCSLPPLLVL